MAEDNPDQMARYLDRIGPQMAYLHDQSAQEGLITDEMVRAPDGVAESSASIDLMVRVAYSLIAPMQMEGGRPALDWEKAQRAGCPPELYHQMTRHPEFMSIYVQALNSTIMVPGLKDAFLAAKQKAAMGDRDAFRDMREMLRIGDNPDEEGIRKQLRSLDDASFDAEVDSLLSKANSLFGKHVAPLATSDRTREILDGEEVLEPPPEEAPIDHASIHGDADNGQD